MQAKLCTEGVSCLGELMMVGVPSLTVMGSEIMLCEWGVEGSGCSGGPCHMLHTSDEIYCTERAKQRPLFQE